MRRKILTVLTVIYLVLVVFAGCDNLTQKEKELKIWYEALDNTIALLSKTCQL